MFRTMIAAAAVLVLAGCASPAVPAEPEPTLPTTFGGSGTFVAGEDFQPGYYQPEAEQPECGYGVQNEAGRTIAMNSGDALLIASAGDVVTLENCGTYTLTAAE